MEQWSFQLSRVGYTKETRQWRAIYFCRTTSQWPNCVIPTASQCITLSTSISRFAIRFQQSTFRDRSLIRGPQVSDATSPPSNLAGLNYFTIFRQRWSDSAGNRWDFRFSRQRDSHLLSQKSFIGREKLGHIYPENHTRLQSQHCSCISICVAETNIRLSLHPWRSRGSSVSTVSDHGMDERGLIPDKRRWFFLSPLRPDRLWRPPSLLSNGYRGGPFPGGKAWPGRDADHSPPSSTEVKNELELYLLSPHASSMACSGIALPFYTHGTYAVKSFLSPTRQSTTHSREVLSLKHYNCNKEF
jgi:hypothetical protein